MNTLLVPDTDAARAVREALLGWSRSGLLQPFCWWSPRDPEEEPVGLQAERIEGGKAEVMPLSAALRGAVEVPRLVAFYPAPAGEGFDASFRDLAERAVGQFDRVLAPGDDRPPSCTMVVAPGATGQEVPTTLFQNIWAANVYVVPEDRPDPDEIDQLPAVPELFIAHAAHAASVLTGLWVQQSPTHLLDALWKRRSTNSDRVQLVRCVSRGIEYGYLADDLAAHVFRPQETWPNPDREHFELEPAPDATVADVTSLFLDEHRDAIGLPSFHPIELEEPEYPSLIEAIKIMLRRWWDIVRRKPRDLLEERIIEPTYERFRRFVADHGGARAKPWRDRDPADRGFIEARDDVTGPLYVPDGPVADAWRELRQTSFGLVDGSHVPESVAGPLARGRSRRALVGDPDAIVPDPQLLPPHQSGAVARACDPLAIQDHRRALAAAAAAVAEAGASAEASSDGTTAVPEAADHGADAPVPPAAAAAPVPEGGEPTSEAEDPLLAWAEGRRRALVWRVGGGIGRALRTAEAEAAAELPEPPSSDPVERSRERAKQQSRTALRFLRNVLIKSVLALALCIASIFVVGIPACLGVWLVVAIGWAWSCGRGLLRVLRDEQDAYSDEVGQDLAYLNAKLKRARRQGDAIRLRRRYDEYLDWAEIIGWFVHRPLVGEPLDSVQMAAPTDPRSLPSAFRLAVGVSSSVRREELLNEARNQLFKPKWLTATYAIATKPPEEHAITKDAVAAVDRRDPEADTHPGDGDSPRKVLLRDTRRGKGRSLRDRTGSVMASRLTDILGDLPLDGLTDAVIPAPAFVDPPGLVGIDPTPPSAEWFSEPAELPDLLDRLRPSIVAVRATSTDPAFPSWGGTGVIIREDGLVVTNRHVADQADTLELELSDGRRVPARPFRMAGHTDLALVLPAEGVELANLCAAPLAEAGDIEQGEAVVTLGHPNLEIGEPTFAWGLTTAVNRRITPQGSERWGLADFQVLQQSFASAGGASGSPVFNLAGRIVGIHCAGADAVPTREGSPAYMSFSVPVAELHALLDDAAVAVPDPAPMPAAEELIAELTASSLLRELLTPGREVALTRAHWESRDAQGEDRIGVPTGALDPSTEGGVALVVPSILTHAKLPSVADIAGVVEYLRPLRILSHRMDATVALSPGRLASCSTATTPSVEEPPAPEADTDDGAQFV